MPRPLQGGDERSWINSEQRAESVDVVDDEVAAAVDGVVRFAAVLTMTLAAGRVRLAVPVLVAIATAGRFVGGMICRG